MSAPGQFSQAIRQWSQRSLANSFALRAASIALISVLVIAAVSVGSLYWTERRAIEAELNSKAGNAAGRIEQSIEVLEKSLAELARSPAFMAALLDSSGRSAYVQPFLQNFSFPVPAASGLALCDINGNRLAGTLNLSDCTKNAAEFQRVLADGKTRRILALGPDGRLLMTIYHGVTFAYTGTTEGVAVAWIALDDLTRPLPASLNLESVTLRGAHAKRGGLVSSFSWAKFALDDVSVTPLFKGDSFTVSGPLELVLKARPHAVWTKLAPLLSAYLIATLALLGTIVLWTRRSAQALVDPLVALRDVAREIATSGDLSHPIPKAGADEVGQLAESLATMVNSIRQSEATRRDAEEQFRLIFEKSNEAITFALPDGRIESANAEACRLFMCSEEEMRNFGRDSIMDVSDPRLPVALEERRRTGTFRGELSCRRYDGSVFPAEVVSSLFQDSKGVQRTTNLFRDQSLRKRFEDELRDSEARYRSLFDIAPDAIFVGTADRILMVNPAALRLLSASAASDLIGRNPIECVHPAYRSIATQQLLRLLESDAQSLPIEAKAMRLDGGSVDVQIVATAFDYRSLRGIHVVLHDITARKEREAELQSSLAELRLRERALGAISQGILIAGPDRLVTYANRGFEEISGYAAGDIHGQSCSFLQGPETSVDSVAQMQAALDAVQPFHGEVLNYRKDGSPFWNELSITPLLDAAGKLTQFVGVLRDVTERKRIELDLQEREARFRSYFELGLIGMAITSPDKGWLQVNDRLCVILGYPRVELTRMTWAELTHPDDLAGDVAHFDRALRGEIEGYSLDKRFIRKDGKIVFATISVSCLRKPDGSADHFVAMLQDITERKESEQERSEIAQRLALLSQHLVAFQEDTRRRLAGELHDRTSPNLAAVGINLEVAAMALQAHDWAEIGERMADNRALIEDTAASIREICADLRPPALDHAGLLPALESYASQYSHRTGIAVTLDCVGRDTKLSRDKESIMFRIFQEALTNTAKHAEATSIKVEVSLDEHFLRLSVSDDGRGFNPETAAESSGLGLINMREMAEFSGGAFALLASPGHGARIQVEIPTLETPP
jgi:PAS domain S-box-containing protein